MRHSGKSELTRQRSAMNTLKNYHFQLMMARLANLPNAFMSGLKASIEADRRACKKAALLYGAVPIKEQSIDQGLDQLEVAGRGAIQFQDRVVPILATNPAVSAVRLNALKPTDSSAQIAPNKLASNPALLQAQRVRENRSVMGVDGTHSSGTHSTVGGEPRAQAAPRKKRLSDVSQARIDAYVASTEKLQKENVS